MKKLILLIVFSLITMTGCSFFNDDSQIDPGAFTVNFEELNFEAKTAKFVVTGLPNVEEYNQISEIIEDSLAKQEITENIEVRVYLKNQKIDTPLFGTVKYDYETKKITENNLNNINEKQYQNQQ